MLLCETPLRSERDDDALIHEMQDALTIIRRHMADISSASFHETWLVRDAVSMRLVILGEAAARLSDEVKAQLPDVNWRGIIGLRHLLAHDYGAADPDVLWIIATQRVGELEAQLPVLTQNRP